MFANWKQTCLGMLFLFTKPSHKNVFLGFRTNLDPRSPTKTSHTINVHLTGLNHEFPSKFISCLIWLLARSQWRRAWEEHIKINSVLMYSLRPLPEPSARAASAFIRRKHPLIEQNSQSNADVFNQWPGQSSGKKVGNSTTTLSSRRGRIKK